jgi:hypothetical protein
MGDFLVFLEGLLRCINCGPHLVLRNIGDFESDLIILGIYTPQGLSKC